MHACSQQPQPQSQPYVTHRGIVEHAGRGKYKQHQLLAKNLWYIGGVGYVVQRRNMYSAAHVKPVLGKTPWSFDGAHTHLGSPKVGPMEEEPTAPRLSGKPREVYDDNDDHDDRQPGLLAHLVLPARCAAELRAHARRRTRADQRPPRVHVRVALRQRGRAEDGQVGGRVGDGELGGVTLLEQHDAAHARAAARERHERRPPPVAHPLAAGPPVGGTCADG